MVGLFCFDGPLYKDKNGVYCNVTLTDEMFSRYFCIVDTLIVVVRTYNSKKTYQELHMKPLTNQNIKVIEVKNFNTPKGFLFDRLQFEKAILSQVEKVDFIFARMPSNISNTILKLACKKKKAYLVEVGGCAWDSYWNHGILGKIVAPLTFYQERKYVEKANYAVYVTKKFLQKRYPNNKETTNCSNVYLSDITDDVIQKRIQKIRRMDVSKVVIGQAVNSVDVKYKGEHLIIQVMKRLMQKGIDIEYQIVGPGNGNYLKTVAKKCSVDKKVKFLGTLTKQEIIDWYQNIDLYVQPSKQEGLPRSVIEAMSVGCPAIGSNIAGIPELIDQDCLFNPNREKEIISTIEHVLNREILEKKAKTNFKRSKEYNIREIELRRKHIFEQYKQEILSKKAQ